LAFFLAFFFTFRRFFLAEVFLFATRRFAVFLRVTFRFLATLRLEAFLRDFFLVAIIFSVSGTRR